MRRPRFEIHPDKISIALKQIQEAAILVNPTTTVTAAGDPDYNIFLECAEAAEANYLITGNRADFPESWANTGIVTPREFLEVIADTHREAP